MRIMHNSHRAVRVFRGRGQHEVFRALREAIFPSEEEILKR
jgi:hypothetical protein